MCQGYQISSKRTLSLLLNWTAVHYPTSWILCVPIPPSSISSFAIRHPSESWPITETQDVTDEQGKHHQWSRVTLLLSETTYLVLSFHAWHVSSKIIRNTLMILFPKTSFSASDFLHPPSVPFYASDSVHSHGVFSPAQNWSSTLSNSGDSFTIRTLTLPEVSFFSDSMGPALPLPFLYSVDQDV